MALTLKHLGLDKARSKKKSDIAKPWEDLTDPNRLKENGRELLSVQSETNQGTNRGQIGDNQPLVPPFSEVRNYPDSIISKPVFVNPSIDSIQETNRGHIGDMLNVITGDIGDNQGTIREHTGNNQETNRGLSRGQIGDSFSGIESLKQGTNRRQIGDNPKPSSLRTSLKYTDALESISRLTGHQRKVFFYIFDQCFSTGTLLTGPITSELLEEGLGIKMDSIKTYLKRLIERELVFRERGKPGRGGFNVFRFDETIYQAAIECKRKLDLESYRGQIGDKQGTTAVSHSPLYRGQIGDYPGDNTVSSSSSTLKEIKNTNTRELSEEWASVDFSSLVEIGFTKNQLWQLASQKENKLTPTDVQESINAFAFDLLENKKSVVSPLNVIMGVLRKGLIYAPPSNYESPKAKSARLLKESLLEQQRRLEEDRKSMLELAFQGWYAKLSAEDIKEITPKGIPTKNFSKEFQRSILMEHFEDRVWRTTDTFKKWNEL